MSDAGTRNRPARVTVATCVEWRDWYCRLQVSLSHAIRWQVRYLDLPDRQDLRKLQQLREEQGELSAADERRLKTLLVGGCVHP